MKHVGLNVAADPLFTVAYTGVSARWWLSRRDDPAWRQQNEQDNRATRGRAVPMLSLRTVRKPTISPSWHGGLRTLGDSGVGCGPRTRVCHSRQWLSLGQSDCPPRRQASSADVKGRVMIPLRPAAHYRLRQKLERFSPGMNRRRTQPWGWRAIGNLESSPQASATFTRGRLRRGLGPQLG